ncbi:hypothetical protein R3P38DRAFT_1321274 [Favolaschia claudopus]|uniref:DRBM domain-containing protein n=1 Tax=Favolaschia claudopus TaxID=2862362 RepID=A0AAW0AYG6_9AGAR
MSNNVSINVVGGTGGVGGPSPHGFAGAGGNGQGPSLTQNLYASSQPSSSSAQVNRSPRSPSEIYTSEMLLQKRGYPLFCPAPQDHHPNISSGIAIGDVGCIDEGEFDYLFNVFSSSNTHCPDDFDSLRMNDPNRLNPSSAEVKHNDIDPRSYFSSTIQREDEDPSKYVFHCSGTCGAILSLPRGAHQQQLKDGAIHLRRYAANNAKSWYQYVVNTRGRDIGNGNLFLVTGHEKARSWGMAHYSDHPKDQNFSLEFRNGPGNVGYAWVSGFPSRAEGKKHDPADGPLNQTLFLRGWTISLGLEVWREEFPSESSSTGWGSSIWPPLVSHLRRVMGLNPPPVVRFDCYPPYTKICNPSVLMNDYIFRQVPSVTVVLSHTDDWSTLLEKLLQTPEADLLEETDVDSHIQTHFKIISEEGAAFLVPKETSSNEHNTFGLNDQSPEFSSDDTAITSSRGTEGVRPVHREQSPVQQDKQDELFLATFPAAMQASPGQVFEETESSSLQPSLQRGGTGGNHLQEDESVEEEILHVSNGPDQTEEVSSPEVVLPDNSAQRDSAQHGGRHYGGGGGGGGFRGTLNNVAQQYGYTVAYEDTSTGPLYNIIWNSKVSINGAEYGRGTGPNRGAAKESAAKRALVALGIIQST